MALLFLRSVLLFFITLIALKAMGKRQLGQMQPIEFVVVLIISEMASLAMQSNTIPLLHSIVPIITLCILQILLAYGSMKSEWLRRVISGKPVPLIKNGLLQEKEMASMRININDLLELCRNQGYFDISAIESLIIETNGELSIQPKTSKRPVTVGDIMLQLPLEQLAEVLILDGHVNQTALQNIGRDQAWLEQRLADVRVLDPRDCFIAGLDESGHFFYQFKRKKTAEGGGKG